MYNCGTWITLATVWAALYRQLARIVDCTSNYTYGDDLLLLSSLPCRTVASSRTVRKARRSSIFLLPHASAIVYIRNYGANPPSAWEMISRSLITSRRLVRFHSRDIELCTIATNICNVEVSTKTLRVRIALLHVVHKWGEPEFWLQLWYKVSVPIMSQGGIIGNNLISLNTTCHCP